MHFFTSCLSRCKPQQLQFCKLFSPEYQIIICLRLLLNMCYIIFVIFDNGTSFLSPKDISLIKDFEKHSFRIRYIMISSRNFSFKKIQNFFTKCVTKCNTAFNSRLYTSPLQQSCRFCKIQRKKTALYLHSLNRVVKVSKLQYVSCILELLI